MEAMIMVATIVKWGNSQGIIIPKAFMEECDFKVDEKVSMEVRNKELVIRPAFRHKTLEERTAECGGNMGDFIDFDWGEPKGRELL